MCKFRAVVYFSLWPWPTVWKPCNSTRVFEFQCALNEFTFHSVCLSGWQHIYIKFEEKKISCVISEILIQLSPAYSADSNNFKRSCLEDKCYFQQHLVNLPQWWRCERAALCVTLSGRLTLDPCPFLFLSSRTGSGDTGRTGTCRAMRRKWKGCSRQSSWPTGDLTPGWCSRNSFLKWSNLCPDHGSDSPPVKLN